MEIVSVTAPNFHVCSRELFNNSYSTNQGGGDKLVSEWSGPYGGLGRPHLWAAAIAKAVAFEREHFTPALPPRVFIESDDCKLLREVVALTTASAAEGRVEVVHLPCTVPEPMLYKQRNRVANVTGHHQWRFNHEHSCDDIARYFAALAIFRDATAVLLGTGGHHGVPLSPAAPAHLYFDATPLRANLNSSSNMMMDERRLENKP